MSYLPDLIPEQHKVIPEYFRRSPTVAAKPKLSIFPVLLGVSFLLIAVFSIRYVGFAALFGLLALSCTGVGTRWLERKGRFALTPLPRICLCALVAVVSVPIYLGYAHQDEVDAAARLAAHERAVQFTADSLRADSGRKQQLFGLLDTAKRAEPDSGLRVIVRTKELVKTDEEKDSIQHIYSELKSQLVQRDLEKRNYKAALASLNELIGIKQTPELWFYRARCYIGLDSMQLAVNDLTSAKAQNYEPASKLFEKVNPLKRHIVGYTTLCNDGSTSSATGRGACSWHGGVAEWNHPIYETYRKYGE